MLEEVSNTQYLKFKLGGQDDFKWVVILSWNNPPSQNVYLDLSVHFKASGPSNNDMTDVKLDDPKDE